MTTKQINVCGGDTVFIPGGGGGGDCDLIRKLISANGTYYAQDDNADGYRAVDVSVPNSYTDSDEGKVVDDGALVAQGSQTITQNGIYDTTLIAELIANISGSEGGKNILYGVAAPDASIGTNGDIYLQLIGTDFTCDPEYYVVSTEQRLSTQSSIFYKINNVPAIAVHYFNNYYYGPLLISTIQDGVKYSYNENPTLSVVVDGVTWYISETNRWSTDTDSPTIPTMYDLGLNVNTTNAEAIVRAILSASNATITTDGAIVYQTYCKVNGLWKHLNGTLISNVSTEGGEAILEPLSVTQNGHYIPPVNVDGFNDVVVNVSGGGGVNILSGDHAPYSSQGNDGDIYLQTQVGSSMYYDSELDWSCERRFYVNSTSQKLSTQTVDFYKTVEGGAIAVQAKTPNGFYGPLLVSTVQNYVKYNYNENPTQSAVIDGVTWYISSNSQWNEQPDDPTIPQLEFEYDPNQSVNTEETIRDILAFASYFPGDHSGDMHGNVISVYFKENGTWQLLIGEGNGIELYFANFAGNFQRQKGFWDNNYFVAFFHDNMSGSYDINNVVRNFSVNLPGNSTGNIRATTISCVNPIADNFPPFILSRGSLFSVSHNDSGSYMNFAAGWCGYPSDGIIYEQGGSNTSTVSITMNDTHDTLLVVVCASGATLSGVSSIDVNGETWDVVNIGKAYDNMYGLYTAKVVENNLDATITVTFPGNCYNYLSIIGIDN